MQKGEDKSPRFLHVAVYTGKRLREKVRVSLGAAIVKEGMDFDILYKAADEGVYKSKNLKDSSFVIV